MKLTDWLSADCLRVPLQVADKWAAITELIGLLDSQGKLTDRERVLSAVVEREHLRATGMEHGLAVPHARSDGCSQPVIAIGLARPPIDFGCVDGKPATVIVLLVGPANQTAPHIQALARISRLMLTESFRRSIVEAGSPEEAYAILVEHER